MYSLYGLRGWNMRTRQHHPHTCLCDWKGCFLSITFKENGSFFFYSVTETKSMLHVLTKTKVRKIKGWSGMLTLFFQWSFFAVKVVLLLPNLPSFMPTPSSILHILLPFMTRRMYSNSLTTLTWNVCVKFLFFRRYYMPFFTDVTLVPVLLCSLPMSMKELF